MICVDGVIGATPLVPVIRQTLRVRGWPARDQNTLVSCWLGWLHRIFQAAGGVLLLLSPCVRFGLRPQFSGFWVRACLLVQR